MSATESPLKGGEGQYPYEDVVYDEEGNPVETPDFEETLRGLRSS